MTSPTERPSDRRRPRRRWEFKPDLLRVGLIIFGSAMAIRVASDIINVATSGDSDRVAWYSQMVVYSTIAVLLFALLVLLLGSFPAVRLVRRVVGLQPESVVVLFAHDYQQNGVLEAIGVRPAVASRQPRGFYRVIEADREGFRLWEWTGKPVQIVNVAWDRVSSVEAARMRGGSYIGWGLQLRGKDVRGVGGQDLALYIGNIVGPLIAPIPNSRKFAETTAERIQDCRRSANAP